MKTKVCRDCKEDKPTSEFYKRKDFKDGLYTRCKECHLVITRENAKRNYWKDPKAKSNYNKSYYAITKHGNVEDNRKRARDWYHNNRGRAISRIRERELKQKSATPPWLSEEHKQQISTIYEHAKDCSIVSGEPYEVDHIVPLQGENISGLHVPWNLQVLPMDVNRAKSNKYGPDTDCPEATRATT